MLDRDPSLRRASGVVRLRAAAAGGAALVLLAACTQPPADRTALVPGGDPDAAPELLRRYGCGGCHTVPGVRGARGLVGPPLTAFGERGYIAGRLVNTPENLVRWIVNPQSVDPETAMPQTGIGVEDASDVAAFLYSLDRGGLGPPWIFPPEWLRRLGSLGKSES